MQCDRGLSRRGDRAPPALLQHAKAAWVAMMQPGVQDNNSIFQANVGTCLKSIGAASISEYVVADGNFALDLALPGG